MFGSLSSLVLLLPSQGKVIYAEPIVEAPEPISVIHMPVLEPQKPLETALHPLQSNLPNDYAYGNCTAFVASVLPVPDWGNANTWDDNALAQGYTVTDVPKGGAIAQSDTDYYLGHVALVTGVNGDVITVTEMNYKGLGIIDTRIANPGEFKFIYF